MYSLVVTTFVAILASTAAQTPGTAPGTTPGAAPGTAPGTTPGTTPGPVTTPEGPAPEGGCTSAAAAATEAGLTTFVTAVSGLADFEPAAAIVGVATSTTPVEPAYTIFAPNNQAFAAVAAAGETNNTMLTEILQLHIINGTVSSTELAASIADAGAGGYNATTISGETLNFISEGESIIVTVPGSNVNATITAVDVATCAGTVHVIDAVLMPAPEAMEGTPMPPPMPGMTPAPSGVVTPAPPATPPAGSGAVGVVAAMLPAVLGAAVLVVAM